MHEENRNNHEEKEKNKKSKEQRKFSTRNIICLLLVFLCLLDASTPLLLGLLAGILVELTGTSLLGLSDTGTDLTVLGLEALGDLKVLVDETEADSATATKLGLEAVGEDGLGVSDLEHLGKKLSELSLGDTTTARVEDVNDELLTLEQTVDGHATHTDGARGELLLLLLLSVRHYDINTMKKLQKTQKKTKKKKKKLKKN